MEAAHGQATLGCEVGVAKGPCVPHASTDSAFEPCGRRRAAQSRSASGALARLQKNAHTDVFSDAFSHADLDSSHTHAH